MGMNVINVWDGALTTLFDNSTTAGYTYIGEANPGSDTAGGRAGAIWRISRITAATGNILWADSKFTQVWDNRASLTYT
jgi:hypothetical protein